MTQTVYINCYDAGDNFPTVDSSTVSDNTNRTWNNIHQWETGSKGLDKPDGSASGWSIEQTAFTEDNLGSILGETTPTGQAATWVDESKISQYLIVSGRTGFSEGTPVTFEITGLTNGNTYWVEVYSSRQTAANDRITEFFDDTSATNSKGTIDSKANTSETLVWSSVAASGKIIITYESREENVPTGECYGYLNCFRVSDNATFAGGGATTINVPTGPVR